MAGRHIVFLYEVGPGAADRSYGIHVAQLAGLPPAVITRAEEVLKIIESGEQGSALVRLADDLPLFQAVAHQPAKAAVEQGPSPLEEAVAAIAPDELTPREALDLIYRLKDLAERGVVSRNPQVPQSSRAIVSRRKLDAALEALERRRRRRASGNAEQRRGNRP